MSIFSINKVTFKATFGIVLVPFAILMVLIVLYFVLFNLTKNQVLGKYEELSKTSEKEEVLVTKLELLSQVGLETTEKVSKTIAALPSTDSTLLAISQIKKLAEEKLVVVNSFKTDSVEVEEGELRKTKISFEVSAIDASLLLDFLEATRSSAPLTAIGDISVVSNDGITLSGKVEIWTYWSPFPDEIPELDSPLVSLTPEEDIVLKKIQKLDLPVISGLQPAEATTRVNPFGL